MSALGWRGIKNATKPIRPKAAINRLRVTLRFAFTVCARQAWFALAKSVSTRFQSIATPVASTARTVASATSGPIPSPGMSVTG